MLVEVIDQSIIEECPGVVFYLVVCCVQAQLALSQFHVTDRMTRQQYYYLNLLEPEPEPRSPENHLQGNTATTAATTQ